MVNAHSEEKFIYTSDSVKLYVNVKGNGPACLYIHGGPGGGSYWLEAFSGDTLEQNFRMIYLDQRGTGNSSSPRDNNYSMERMIRDFEEVREALDIKQWIILGHSFAGIPMMGYVLNQPDVIIGLIFINCTLSMNDSFEKSWMPRAIELVGEDVPAKCLDPSVSLLERMMAISPVLNKKNIRWKLFYTSEENNQKMSETYSHYKNWNGDFSEKGLEVPDYWDDFLKLTSKVEQPVLFYYGIQDWAVGPDHYKGIEFPEMLLWRSEGGHMPFLENKDDLANAIRAYLNRYKLE
jgi:proline iminopeptidase